MGTPCASWRVVRYVEGYEDDSRWCERVAGACPFPETNPSRFHGERSCAASAEDYDPHAPYADGPRR